MATTETTCSQSTKTVCAHGVATAKTSHGTSLLCHSRTCILLASIPSMPGEIKIVNPLGPIVHICTKVFTMMLPLHSIK